jgi:hypothetical protein
MFNSTNYKTAKHFTTQLLLSHLRNCLIAELCDCARKFILWAILWAKLWGCLVARGTENHKILPQLSTLVLYLHRLYSWENTVYWKKIFSRTSRRISIKLGINHPWVKEILNCLNKGPGPLQRGDKYKTAKMEWGHLKIFISRTNEPE